MRGWTVHCGVYSGWNSNVAAKDGYCRLNRYGRKQPSTCSKPAKFKSAVGLRFDCRRNRAAEGSRGAKPTPPLLQRGCIKRADVDRGGSERTMQIVVRREVGNREKTQDACNGVVRCLAICIGRRQVRSW